MGAPKGLNDSPSATKGQVRTSTCRRIRFHATTMMTMADTTTIRISRATDARVTRLPRTELTDEGKAWLDADAG